MEEYEEAEMEEEEKAEERQALSVLVSARLDNLFAAVTSGD